MKIAGIIAEYNPFHTGHAYHIAQTRALTGADGVAVLMSGNFVQRGGPAVADKWVRAKAAVAGGADLVLELPTRFAHAPAQVFAAGAVQSFEKSGCIDVLSFGVENADFMEYAQRIVSKEAEIEAWLRNILTPQLAYPAAYASAVEKVCEIPDAFLSAPNNMLALEYVKALVNLKAEMEPLAVARVGALYHDSDEKEGYVSATAMRKLAAEGDVWLQYMPETVADIYKNAKKENRFPVSEQQFDVALLSFLRRMPADAFSQIADMPQGFENRIVQLAKEATGIEALTELCSAKQYTTARVRRLIWNCFLGITRETIAEPTYLRVLAFNEVGRVIIKRMKETSSIPLIIKTADAEQDAMLSLDICATDLYFSSAKSAEYRRGGLDYLVSPTLQDV